jgi:hypothetical protein
VFVRGGLVVDGGFEPRDWAPGAVVDGAEAPRVADCVPVRTAALGDLTDAVARGMAAPDTALTFHPDGSHLAVGTVLGEVVVLGPDGAEVRRTLAESAVKQVAWSPDGATLYAAEQSPDAWIHALDPRDLSSTGPAFRLADAVETSAPPGPDDLYGLYTLPAAYGLSVRADGRLLVLGTHGWNTPEGRRNRSQLLRLRHDAEGFAVDARWPDEPADATFLALEARDVERVGVAVSRSSDGPDPAGLPIGGVAVLDADTLDLLDAHVPEPLTPWFDRAFVWEAIGLGDGRITLGLADGRIWRPGRIRDLSTPLLAGDVPIAATIGSLVDGGDAIFALTSGTSIPFSASRAELQPPEPHPAENTLFALDPETLETRWAWHGSESLHGMAVSERWVAVGTAPGEGGAADQHGVIVFDRTGAPGRSGSDRIAALCSTGQPVFFRPRIAPDGRIAVVSFPEKQGDVVRGEYRVTIFR